MHMLRGGCRTLVLARSVGVGACGRVLASAQWTGLEGTRKRVGRQGVATCRGAVWRVGKTAGVTAKMLPYP